MTTLKLIDLDDIDQSDASRSWLTKSERVLRQLRTNLPADYADTMRGVYADGGRMSLAVRGDEVVGVAVHRIWRNTASGLHMYVDDLVTDEPERSTGVGKALIEHLEQLARTRGCAHMLLDAGTQRMQAHRFYLRERFVIVAFQFFKRLTHESQ